MQGFQNISINDFSEYYQFNPKSDNYFYDSDNSLRDENSEFQQKDFLQFQEDNNTFSGENNGSFSNLGNMFENIIINPIQKSRNYDENILNENNSSTNIKSKLEKFNKNKELIFNIEKDLKKKEKTEEIKFLNKKRNPEKKYFHSKYDFDNMSRKMRSKFFGAIRIILNKALEEDEENKIKNEKFDKKIKKSEIPYKRSNIGFVNVNSEITQSTNIKYNQELLNKTIKNIFSENVSKKAKNFTKDELNYNKILIQKIEKDPEKVKTNKILNCGLLECLEHFRKEINEIKKPKPELKGLKELYDKIINDYEEKDKEFALNFKKNVDEYEKILMNKRPRKSRKETKKKYKNENDCNY